MLDSIIFNCKRMIKPEGFVLIADFTYVDIPNENFFFGMRTEQKRGKVPNDFEEFHFIIPQGDVYDIFNIHPSLMFKSAVKAGFKKIEFKPQYPDPEYMEHPVVRRYLDTCNPCDYLLTFRHDKL